MNKKGKPKTSWNAPQGAPAGWRIEVRVSNRFHVPVIIRFVQYVVQGLGGGNALIIPPKKWSAGEESQRTFNLRICE